MNIQNKTISISIGIPAYNEEKNIKNLINNLLNQNLKKPFVLDKILVVASGCTDNTAEIVDKISKENKIISLINQKNRRGKASAINYILNKTKSEIIVFMGADVIPKRNSLYSLVLAFINSQTGAVGGHPIPINKSKRFAGAGSNLVWDLHHIFSKIINVKVSGEFFAVKRRLIDHIYSKINCDDAYIEYFIRKQKYKIKYSSKAIVYIKGPDNFKDFMNQRRRIHAGHNQINQITKKKVSTTSILKNIKVLTKIFKKYYKNQWFLLIILMEAISRLQGYIDYLKGKYHIIWKRIDSTKSFEIDEK